jgi:hypothetical protein
MSQGLAEAFSSPLQPSALGNAFNQLGGPEPSLADAFAQPIQSSVTIEQTIMPTIEIEGNSIPMPEGFDRLSEEEQAVAIEEVAKKIREIRQKNENDQKIINELNESINKNGTAEVVDEVTKDAVGGFPGFFPGAYGGAKFMSALAPHPLLKPGMALVGGLGGGIGGSAVTGPYVRAVTDPMVDGAKDFVENKTVLGKQGMASLGEGAGVGVPSIIDNSSAPYTSVDSSSTGVLPPTPLVP